ncbi:unnamed protein product [Triticum turgidum subsp. durum]|uniref:Uncharacterized protein n=1 Tax=Triticum turgidum subsp. durum TaxID=4567 RepID=A0A9R0YJE6_TRITD|nr:unnamed protein product [Triticum turgidum subsp. durum]
MEIARSAAAVGCSKEHQRIYADWFAIADPDGDGRVTGADATKFFAMSGLSRADLKQVWAIADSKRQGYLGFGEFAAAMQLVSLAQAGNEITQDSLKREDLSSFDPPVMKGLDELLARSMAIVNVVRPQENGTPQVQAPSTNSWFSSKSAKKIQTPLTAVTSVIDGLKRLYIEKLKPLEVAYRFNDFASPLLTNSDFDAKPMVMLLGQYSTGKTTFIKHLLKTNFPGLGLYLIQKT